MAVTFRPLSPPTDAEMLALHELNPGYRVERLPNGALRVSPNGSKSAARSADLTYQLRTWQLARGGGGIVLDSSGGCVLPDTALFGPDSAYIGPERWDALTPAQQEKYFQGAPDAAFEIVSQSDSRTEQLEKAEAYARNGSALVVLIDPYRRAVDVWRGGVHEALGDAASVVCDPVMPGFVLNVSAILRV